MKTIEWKRITLQGLICAVLLGLYLLRFPGAAALYFQLVSICLLSIIISTAIELKVKLSGTINSIVINLVAVFLFYGLGNYLGDYLTLEIVETIKPELENSGVGEGAPKVLTAIVIGFSGWEFLFIYGINAIFAYTKYLPDFAKKEVQNENLEIKEGGNNTSVSNKFSIRQGGKLHFIDYDQINYVEASGNYINIFSSGKKYTLRESLQDWLSKTGKDHLLRVHRSFIINTNSIKELSSSSDGQYSVLLDSGDSVKVGKQYKASLFEFLGLN